MAWGTYNRGKASIWLGVRVTACALVGLAVIFVVLSDPQKQGSGSAESEVALGQRGLLYDAERIARGLEEKNRKRADDVVIPYTREDKILDSFQREVKARDEKFRHEVATFAKESKDEEMATKNFDNNGDPDDPHFKTSTTVLPASQVPQPSSPFELEKEEKSEKIQNHIDHEVEEITGGDQSGSHRQHKAMVQTHQISTQRPAIPTQATEKVTQKPDSASLSRYMKSEAFKKARAAALEHAQKMHAVHRHPTDVHAKTTIQMTQSSATIEKADHAPPEKLQTEKKQQVKANEDAAPEHLSSVSHIKEAPHTHLPKEHVVVRQTVRQENELPINLRNYMKVAPSQLNDYMHSEGYKHTRDLAEKRSEQYFEEHEEHAAKESAVENSIQKHVKGTKSTLQGQKESGHPIAHKEIKSYMASAAFKTLEEQAEENAIRSMRISAPTKKIVTHHEANTAEAKKLAAERALLKKYIAGTAFKHQETQQAAKYNKIEELRRYMGSEEFKRKEARARSSNILRK